MPCGKWGDKETTAHVNHSCVHCGNFTGDFNDLLMEYAKECIGCFGGTECHFIGLCEKVQPKYTEEDE